MEVIALMISVASLLASIVVYFVHDKKLKDQQMQINTHVLANIEEDERLKKTAQIFMYKVIEQNARGHNNVYLVIQNTGKAKARNLKVWAEPNMLLKRYEVDYFNPSQEERRVVVHTLNDPDSFEAFCSWDDDLGSHKESVIISFG